MELGHGNVLDQKTDPTAFQGDSQARISIRSYYFVGNCDNSIGAYRLEDRARFRENARDSGKEEKKAAELNHRE